MSAKKVILLTCVLLLAGAGVAFAVRKKKIGPVKNTTVTAGDPVIGQPDALKQGSQDAQHVSQLQEVLNALHNAAAYINKNCGGIKWGYMGGGLANGNIVKEDGTFDTKTAAASKYYLNREEVELDYLEMMRKKIAKYKTGDKCIYPMAIVV